MQHKPRYLLPMNRPESFIQHYDQSTLRKVLFALSAVVLIPVALFLKAVEFVGKQVLSMADRSRN